MMKRALLVAVASAFLFACGGDDDNDLEQSGADAGGLVASDAGTEADAGTPGPDAGAPGADAGTIPNPSCTVAADLGDLAASDAEDIFAEADPVEAPAKIYFDAYFDDFDFGLELHEGAGVFSKGIKTGTFVLQGEELQYRTCGLCVRLNSFLEDYLATGGTVTLTSVANRLVGSISNVTFEHVTLDEDTWVSSPVGDGCVGRIGSFSFDVPLDPMTIDF